MFEFIDRIRLDRVKDIQIDHIEKCVTLLESYCSEIEYKDFILGTIKESFYSYKELNLSLSDAIPKLTSSKYHLEKHIVT
jgi:hypothetical protein